MNQNVRLDNFSKMTFLKKWPQVAADVLTCQAEQQLSVSWLSWEHVESFAGASKQALPQQYVSKSRNLCLILLICLSNKWFDSVFLLSTKGCIKNLDNQLTNLSQIDNMMCHLGASTFITTFSLPVKFQSFDSKFLEKWNWKIHSL